MEIVIKGTEKEIAALIVELQGLQRELCESVKDSSLAAEFDALLSNDHIHTSSE